MVTVLHSGRDRCTMTTFQTAIAAAEDETPFTTRTGQGILSYLGELIAAQNYSAHRYTPELFIDAPDGRQRTVPLFEVRRGMPGQGAGPLPYRTTAGASTYPNRPSAPSMRRARSRCWTSCRKSSRRPHPGMHCPSPRPSHSFRRGSWLALPTVTLERNGLRARCRRRAGPNRETGDSPQGQHSIRLEKR
jgi:hypothetical protein